MQVSQGLKYLYWIWSWLHKIQGSRVENGDSILNMKLIALAIFTHAEWELVLKPTLKRKAVTHLEARYQSQPRLHRLT